jgi:hypothetical protein
MNHLSTPLLTDLVKPSRLHGDRIWRHVGERDHVTRDGRQIVWAVWRSQCVVCGSPFDVSAPKRADALEKCKSFETVTCTAHRMTASEAGKIRFATPATRRAVFETIKAAKLAKEVH